MYSKSMKCVLLTLAASGFASLAQAGSIDAMEGFGDSLSDAGNALIATGGTIAGPPYSAGWFSNGNVWVPDLALDLGLGLLTPSLARGTDDAVGSADLPYQITLIGNASPGGADPSALYTICIGSNDLGVIPAGTAGPLVQADVAAIISNRQRDQHAGGARGEEFFWWSRYLTLARLPT